MHNRRTDRANQFPDPDDGADVEAFAASNRVNRGDIRAEDAEVLDANAESMKANPKQLILIEGHADQRGTSEYNLALADRRAKASMNYLVSRGVRSNRISIISYGKERPMCMEASEDCWSQNRRAHFMVKGQ
jgi:peptidoglycan-associated lipoprotein